MLSLKRKLALYQILEAVPAQLELTSDPQKALRHGLHASMDFLQASHGCVARLLPGTDAPDILFGIPSGASWDGDLLAEFIRCRRPTIPANVLIAPLRRRGRAWGALALRREGVPFERGDGHSLTRIATTISDAIQRIDRERVLEVRGRIDRKIMEQIRPQDLFYQILHGLRSLTQYDHSSALLMRDDKEPALTVVAEQIAWVKGKSWRVGLRLPLPEGIHAMLASGGVHGFDRHEERWLPWEGDGATALAEILDYNRTEAPGASGQREGVILCAPLAGRDGVFGLLKIASRFPGTFGRYEADLVEGFRYQAAVALQNSRRNETLHARMLDAERKHAMAELARGVSHDVNNALGSVLPLVQQLREDAGAGRVDAGTLSGDLDQIERSLQLCRRIFGGMLALARGSARATGHAHVRAALDGTLAILKDGMARRGIEISLDIPADLPAVAGGQGDMDQVFLNLLTNAQEAMPRGGRLSVTASAAGNEVQVRIADTGRGIRPEDLPRILEPFFTTKPQGTGLGLSICRSILWQTDGEIRVESEVGRGTTVTLQLARARSGGSGGAA